jgi:hypothetical protein
VVTTENRLEISGALRGVPADIQVFHHPGPKRRGAGHPVKRASTRRHIRTAHTQPTQA